MAIISAKLDLFGQATNEGRRAIKPLLPSGAKRNELTVPT